METARLALERGGTVVIFPEGTRIRSGALARPKRGVGRLALETGASVLPVAVIGSEQVRRGLRIRPRKVRLRAGQPMTFPRTSHPSPALAATVTERIWPNIELQWEWLGGLPPLRKAAVIGAGSWGTAVAVLLAKGGLEVQLGTRTADKAAELSKARKNESYLPGITLDDAIDVKKATDIELAGVDLICFAVPAKALPVGCRRDGRSRRLRVPPCSCSARAWCSRSGPCPATMSRSVCARARSPRSAGRPWPARRPAGRPPWSSALRTPTCAPSSARSSTVPA